MACDKDLDSDTKNEMLFERYLQEIQDEVDQDIISRGGQPSTRRSVTLLTESHGRNDVIYTGIGSQKAVGQCESELCFRGISDTADATRGTPRIIGAVEFPASRNFGKNFRSSVSCSVPVLGGYSSGAQQPKEVEDRSEPCRSTTDSMRKLHTVKFADTYLPTRSGSSSFLESQVVIYPKGNKEESRSNSSDLIEFDDEDDNPAIPQTLCKVDGVSKKHSLCVTVSESENSEYSESIIPEYTNYFKLGRHQATRGDATNEDEPLEFQDLVQYLERKKLELAISQVRAEIKRVDELILVEKEVACHRIQTNQVHGPNTAPTNLCRPVASGHSLEAVGVPNIPGLDCSPDTLSTHPTKVNHTDDNTSSPDLSRHATKEIAKNNGSSEPEIQKCAGLETQSRMTSSTKCIPSTHEAPREIPKSSGSKRTKNRKATRIRAAERLLAITQISNVVDTSAKTPETFGAGTLVPELGIVKKDSSREIHIENLPPGIALKTILSKVRGGLLDRVCYSRSLHTVTIVFFEHSAALKFCRYLQKFPLAYPVTSHPSAPLRLVNVFPLSKKLVVEPSTPERKKAVLNRGATRCLFIGFLPQKIGMKMIEHEIIHRLGRRQKKSRDLDELIESIEKILEPEKLTRRGKRGKSERKDGMCVIARLASISLALNLMGYLRSRPEYNGVELSFVEDECAGSLLPPVAVTTGKDQKSENKSPLARCANNKHNASLPSSIPTGVICPPASIGNQILPPSSFSRDHEYNEVYLGNLPPFMNAQALARWIRGGKVDTIYSYKDIERSSNEAVVFFTTIEGARRYYNFILTYGMIISGRVVFALKSIPHRIKATRNPRSFLQGRSHKGLSRFVRVWGVENPQKLLQEITKPCEQQPIIDSFSRGVKGPLKDVTFHFMSIGDAVRAVDQLKRINIYRSLRTEYVSDMCDNDVMDLARFASRQRLPGAIQPEMARGMGQMGRGCENNRLPFAQLAANPPVRTGFR